MAKRASTGTASKRGGTAETLRANRASRGAADADPAAAPLVDGGVRRDAAGVILAVVAVASFIAVVSPATAPVTRAIAGFYHLGFGLGGYLLPLVLLAASALLFVRERVSVPPRSCIGAAMVFLAAISLFSLFIPGVDAPAQVLFAPGTLAVSGGYVGSWVAFSLRSLLGTPITAVVLLGFLALGLIVTGLSVGDVVRAMAERAARLSRRRHIDVNEAPWGSSAEGVGAAGSSPGQAMAQSRLFDETGAQETTFLGDREASAFGSDAAQGAPHDEDDEHENPLVDLSGRMAAFVDRIKGQRRAAASADASASGTDATRAEAASVDPAGAKPTTVLPAGSVASVMPARTGRDDATAATAAPNASAIHEEVPWDEPQVEREAPASSASGQAKGDLPIPSFLAHAAAGAAPSPGDAADAGSPAFASALAGVSPAASSEDDERELPPASMLRHNPQSAQTSSSSQELEQTAGSLQSTLAEFGLKARVVGWIAGPTVTTFKVQPGEGERVSRISNLEDDIALSLATDSVRIFAPIPGTSLVGIEIPNRTRQTVDFGDILPYVQGGPLEFALGRDAEGQPMVADLAKMPHLLIAGTTGSGKSVVISSIVMSLLMRTFPEDVRLIMIDPKRVEFAPYDGLPHLYVPVVTEPKQAASALQWAVSEMERRLKIFERIGVRKIATFNEKQAAGDFEKYDNPPAKMPYLVIVIDELSDLMMVAGKDVEASIVRIAQLGRAAGIHMIVATQRPSSNVVTGLIKANITNRIGLTVATGVDSRVILDQAGAEKLIGQGDMLFSRVDWGKPKRIQGCYVSDEEIAEVVAFVKEQNAADYHEEILSAVTPAAMGGGAGAGGAGEPAEDDPLLWDAARIVVDSQLGSTSGLQRRLKVGYARAGRIMDMLEEKGIVGPPDGSKPREVLLDMEALQALEARESPLTEEEIRGF